MLCVNRVQSACAQKNTRQKLFQKKKKQSCCFRLSADAAVDVMFSLVFFYSVVNKSEFIFTVAA